MRTCIVCRCTEDLACVDELHGPCHWRKLIGKNKGVCSACPEPVPSQKLAVKQRAERDELRDRVRRIEEHRRMQANNFRSAQEGYELVVEQMRSLESKLRKKAA